MRAIDRDSQTLARLSRLSRAEMLNLQFAKLKRQLERIYAQNAFYRSRFDAAGVKLDQIRSLDDFRARVPAMGKRDCLDDQGRAPPFGERVGVPRERVVLVNLTGGTSGLGQEVYGRTNYDVAMQGYYHYLPWFMAGLRAGQVALNCVPAGGLTTGGWGPSEGFRMAGATSFPAGGTMSTDAKIDLMCRFGAFHFIYASTSYMHTLTEALRRRGIDPKKQWPTMQSLFTVAEPYPIEWAQRIEEFWGARLHEGYGSTQAAGFCASTCECGAIPGSGRGVMHIFEWHAVVEVIDPQTMQPVRPGEEGEIVLTNLDIEGSPVIRFRTGDKTRLLAHDACRCGRSWLGLEAGTIGRLDDMMKIRGNNMWPSAVDQVVFAHREVWEYAGHVHTSADGRTQVDLRVALKPDTGLSKDDIERLFARLQTEIKAATNVSMNLIQVDRSDLPNYDYKSRRWKDERSAGFKSGAVKQ